MEAFAFWKNFDEAIGSRTLKSVVEGAGLNYRTIKNQRSGLRLPNLDDAYALSVSAGVTLDYLISGNRGAMLSPEAQAVSEDPELRLLVRAVMRDRRLLSALAAVVESGERAMGSVPAE